jgi:hypothetical protein
MANNDPVGNLHRGPMPKPPPTGEKDDLIAEAEALALFVARRGDLLAGDEKRIAAYQALREAINEAATRQDGDNAALLGAYSSISAFTYAELGVNGRTILDTNGRKFIARHATEDAARPKLRVTYLLSKPRHRPLLIGGILLFMVAAYEGILLILGGTPNSSNIIAAMTKAKELLVPLVWGALGTCTFLMKKLSDRLSEFAFEETRARGMEARVFLGAILALIVVELLRKELGDFPSYLIAFLAGLGIKPVYAAIEGLVEGLAARVKPPKQGGKS